ncbi:hypothetical protein BDA99DRAFT_502400 [Phascolomyces articulosus]|uniref:HCP-like protein n=1 Tax=Phascolomyces articulosus TaxID=60185 RepID=A0AAD5KH04_9FUNG|nr:hypothetical protein BDA99DRAFT_502400 [Phascolomyces articulosus]
MGHVDNRPISLVENSSNNSSVTTPRYHHLDLHRFSLDMDQVFETVERRSRRDMDHSANQWFYDEFSGMYRHKAPPGHLHHLPSINTIQPSSPSLRRQQSQKTPSVVHHRQHSSITSSLSPPQQQPVINQVNTPTLSWEQILSNGLPYPWPESVEQIHGWRDETRRTPQWMLQLAIHLMSISTSDPLRSVGSHEAYRLLKRLTQYRGHVASEAHYLLAKWHGFRNPDQAFSMYTQASKQNHREATYRTAVCHELGLGTHQDFQRAFVFYRKAAHLGHPESMYKLGIVLMEGQLDQTIHKREAISWLQRAAETNSIPLAQHTLAMIQLTPAASSSLLSTKNNNTIRHHPKNISNHSTTTNDTGLIIEDYPYAIGLLYDAAREGFAPSQVKLAECFELGLFVHPDMDLALYWYTKAAESGNNAEAALALSGIYLTGFGQQLEQSDHQAYLWARKAAFIASNMYRQYGAHRWTLAKAYFMVGYYTEYGIGIRHPIEKKEIEEQQSNNEEEQDILDPIKWYKRAADLGHAAACKRVTSLSSNIVPEKKRQTKSNNNNNNRCIVM